MRLAIDTETEPIAPGVLSPRLVCLSTYNGKRVDLISWRDAPRLVEHYLCNNVEIVGHNIAYDLAVLARAGVPVDVIFRAYDRGQIRCTRIREALDAIAVGDLHSRGQSLDAIYQARCKGAPLDKSADGWRLRYGELRDVPLEQWPERAAAYAKADAVATWDVFHAQGGGRDIPDELPQTKAAFALHLMGVWGVRVDGERLEKVDADLDATETAALLRAQAAGYLRPDGSKDMQRIRAAVEAAFHAQGLKAPKTDGGSIATDAETLERTGDPGLVAISQATHYGKLRGTYVEAYRAGVTQPLNPAWVPLVSSGRTSCREPNLQNPPRNGGLRECIIPRKGFVFVSVDYEFLELRTLAQSCLDLLGFSHLADAIRAGEDPHLSMGASLLGITYAEALARRKDPDVKDARQLAKAANFGLPGGMGAQNFRDYAWASYRVRLTEAKARDLIAAYYKRWPEIKKLFDVVKSWTRSGSATITLPRIGRVRGDCGFTDGCNQLFQGPAASGAKAALYAVSKACYTDRASPLFGSRPVLFLHDEIIAEIPEDRIHEAGHEMARIMREEMVRVATPDLPSGAEPAAMRRWSKQAETKTNEAGRLITWD